MKKLYEMPGTVVNIKTQEEWNEYMRMCENVDWTWCSSDVPTALNYFSDHREDSGVVIRNTLEFGRIKFYKKEGWTILTLTELKRRLGMWKEGDVIIKHGNTRKILAVCGKLIAKSYIDDHAICSSWCTQEELEGKGWKLASDVDQEADDAIKLLEKKGRIKNGKIVI